MRIGVIGLGRMGAFHVNTLLAATAVDSLVVADIAADRVKQIVDDGGVDRVRGADSVAALLDSGVHGVIVAAGTNSHTELIAACVEAGLPVLCEKPLARTGAEGAALVRHLAGSAVPVQIGLQRRHDVAFAAVKTAVDKGELGFLTTIRSTTLDPEPYSQEFMASSGGMFRDCGVHDFDTIRWLSGQDAVEVYAVGSNQGARFFSEYGDVDTSAVVVTLAEGTLGLVSNTRYNGRGYDVRVEVHGSQDSVAAGIDHGWPMRSAEPGADFPAGPPHRLAHNRFGDAYRREVNAFLEVVAGDRPSPCTMEDALEADWIAEACMRSVRERRPVRIEEVRG
ncbi:myo-inositol 2-dehydrogenase/D-chiro-inositol 1-dehydrogenase [Lentzea atacamensis]|uniref:Myo-inositol 2-dehydrogenase/D-chiro-inositol 1-dehydrogenase n=1 Tax=Lentzea atacamensis TaxID=531938 RepID=A0A316I022_9PSEU|nr:Gfo/Idh/MocA family oxidoreductase [Lentzea atacamensis]PWK80682.1 myo-inositol 2-dehydrogenase/D-chiro-inositol 1-dehydrogenase [Lentzea atacamensis]